MARKTAKIRPLIEWANGCLANPEFDTEFKSGICAMVNRMLLDADAYCGFLFIKEDGTIPAKAPGVDDPKYYDRVYSISPKI